MADPFSIVTATIGVIDVCWRFSQYLRDTQLGAATVDDDVESLSQEIEALTAVTTAIQASYKDLETSSISNDAEWEQIGTLWSNIGSNVELARLIVEDLERLVRSIAGKELNKEASNFTRKVGSFQKQLRKQSKEGEFYRLQSRLKTYYSTLQLMLDLVILTKARHFHKTTNESIEQLNILTGKSFGEIKSELALLQETLRLTEPNAPRSLVDSPTISFSNEHFSVPQGDQRYYTGRFNNLEDVKHAFAAPCSPGQSPIQKRIVIYGLGGSGKTQFCCKYAQANRQSYWGIFWINASSEKLAKQTYQDIAKVGRVDESVSAAKRWLTNLKTSWLLIIDNADDPELILEEYIPQGERGHILITTRIPSNKDHGTVGPKFLHFEGLKVDDASNLLLRTASEPAPWDTSTQNQAASITEALGFLPLALLHAGKAIMKRLCKLEDYLNYHQVEKQKVREARDLQGFRKGDNIYMNVYSTFEINFRGLQLKATKEADDAIQLLQMLSFFHRENIRAEFFTKAALNPVVEKKEREKDSSRAAAHHGSEKTWWVSRGRDLLLQFGIFLLRERTPPVLPDFIRDCRVLESSENYRLNAALNELTQLSLITYNDSNDSYSMHPVVHTWARERPEFVTIEQAVWCQAAATTLAQCILLPPLASTEADERLRQDLLPHVDHVRERQREIDQRIKEKQQQCKTKWLYCRTTTSRTHIGHMARFSRVYAQGGKWDEALELQLAVEDFCLKMLGPNHTSTMTTKLALSGTYWQLGQGNRAAELQEQVLTVYRTTFGENDRKTLKTMGILGESRRMQGRLIDSFNIHDRAYNGLMMILGPDHEDTLKAGSNLGRDYSALWQPEQARILLRKVISSMKRNVDLGPAHLDTLTAMNDLAMTYLANEGAIDVAPVDLGEARQLMTEVLSKRLDKLGKEHPYTLWAIVNLARVKAEMGGVVAAEAELRAALLIAERNLGDQHHGTLLGKFHLGDILIVRGQYEEAEELLREVAECHQRRTGEHPHRCKALDDLSKCYRLQGRFDEAIEKCREAVHEMEIVGGHNHPYVKQLRSQCEQLIVLQLSHQSRQISPDERESCRL